MKKLYYKPSVDVLEILSSELMQSLTISSEGGGGGGGGHMPRRGDIIP